MGFPHHMPPTIDKKVYLPFIEAAVMPGTLENIPKKGHNSMVSWWDAPEIPATWRMRWADHKLKTILGYIQSEFKASGGSLEDPVSK